MSTGKRGARHGAAFTYHPFEVALCGFPGAGKTTLALRLLRHWGGRYRVGYARHDAHGFEMDGPGKDTFAATEAGATAVLIHEAHRHARLSIRPLSRFERVGAFVDVDFVLAEGVMHSDLPQVLLLDEAGRAWEAFQAGAFSNVRAFAGAGAQPEETSGALPYFHRDDVDGLAAFIEAHVQVRAATPLYGLVLAGGESRRMGAPKWALDYAGEPHAHRTARLLGAVCARVFLSVRPGQDERRLPDRPVISDAFPAWGPLAGLLSAMEAHPEAAWLVAACDLPFLDAPTLDALVAARAPLRIATAYRSAHDGLPEPLCAIWEPRARQRLLQAAGLGLTCPRKVLVESAPALLDLADPRALENANTPSEYEAARAALRATP